MDIIFFILAAIFLILWLFAKKKYQKANSDLSEKTEQLHIAEAERDTLKEQYSDIIDAEQAAAEIKREASKILDSAKEEKTLAEAESKRIISDAEAKALEIAGDAYSAMGKAKEYEKYLQAIKRTIEGYGDEWLKPSYSLLDELAADFSYTDAGQKLKEARDHSVQMMKAGQAANCDYSEPYRRITAIQFVVDAFNGKVDSLLSKVKQDNYGILERKIKDSYELVNKNGSAFRNAHILPEYLNARLDELKWAVIVQELKAKAAEEQRALREKMREEEKARREFERAQKEAEKEEAMLKKAMEKAKALLPEIKALVKNEGLDMKVISAECNYNFSRLTINFTAENRVDFRDLVKKLADNYKVRIDLRQIGPRDTTRILGGYGPCGLECCCHKGFGINDHISIKMAKNQGLSLSPNSISGLCGKMLCCLAYENEYYQEIVKKMPKLNSIVLSSDGEGKVIYNDLLHQTVSVKYQTEQSSEIKEYTLEEFNLLKNKNKN